MSETPLTFLVERCRRIIEIPLQLKLVLLLLLLLLGEGERALKHGLVLPLLHHRRHYQLLDPTGGGHFWNFLGNCL